MVSVYLFYYFCEAFPYTMLDDGGYVCTYKIYSGCEMMMVDDINFRNIPKS